MWSALEYGKILIRNMLLCSLDMGNLGEYTMVTMPHGQNHFPRRNRLRRSWMTFAKAGNSQQQVAHQPWRICCEFEIVSDAEGVGRGRVELQKSRKIAALGLWVVVNRSKAMKCHENAHENRSFQ